MAKTDIALNSDGEVTLYVGGKKTWRGPVAGLATQLGLAVAALPPKEAARQKPKSRSAQWRDACAAASSALEDLVNLQQEYSDWKSNLPENLQSSALGDKLDAVCDIDITGAQGTVEECESADLPQGFGRD